MPLLRKRFYHNANPAGYQREAGYDLARDTKSGRVFIIHQWVENSGNVNVNNLEIQSFLSANIVLDASI